MHGLDYFLFSYLHPICGPGLDRYDRKAMEGSGGRLWLQRLGDAPYFGSAVVENTIRHYGEEMHGEIYEHANQRAGKVRIEPSRHGQESYEVRLFYRLVLEPEYLDIGSWHFASLVFVKPTSSTLRAYVENNRQTNNKHQSEAQRNSS
jgi:hypothetical protein